jgi:hypothetical protein
MTFVVLYTLFGDDIRAWLTPKEADPYFYVGFIFSMVLFAVEITVKTVVDEDYKYSFFFWLDIVATVTLVIDIPWLLDPLIFLLFGTPPDSHAVNVTPGLPKYSSETKLTNVVKSLRLIRLIRILKIYKYIFAESEDKESKDDKKNKKKKKKQSAENNEVEEKEETQFVIETDPVKLGSKMRDTLNK